MSSNRGRIAELLVGFHPVREGLRHRPEDMRRVLIAEGRGGARRLEIEDLCRAADIPFEVVAASVLAGLGVEVHNGFAAELQAAKGRRAEAAEARDEGLVVLLEDIQDPRNLGAILRVCEGAGVGRVMVRDRGSAPLTAAVARTAAGATEWLSVDRITNTAQELERLKRDGFWIYGAAMEGVPPWKIDLTGKAAILLGGEENGLRHRTRELCDGLIGLPMRGHVESLNVSAAAAAILYEAVRQRSG